MPDSIADIEQTEESSEATSEAGSLGLGDRLRSARKAKSISLEFIAEALHLDESLVDALEDERFDELGAPVFVRGHLKTYAKLVGLPPETMQDVFRDVEPQSLTVPSVRQQSNRSLTFNPVQWGFAALVLILVLVLGVYVLQGDDAETLEPIGPATAEPASDDVVLSVVDPVRPADSPEPEPQPQPERVPTVVVQPAVPAVAEPEPATITAAAVEIEPAATESPTSPAGNDLPVDVVRVSLHFREESWVEISDANKRLLFGLQREGRQRELTGEPPINLLIGNAAGVDLRVNGQAYAVPSSGVTGKVARFEIDAPVTE